MVCPPMATEEGELGFYCAGVPASEPGAHCATGEAPPSEPEWTAAAATLAVAEAQPDRSAPAAAPSEPVETVVRFRRGPWHNNC